MTRTDIRMIAAAVAFPLVVLASTWGRGIAAAGWQDTLLGLLPLVPAAALGWLGFEHMRHRDEMLRRIQLEAAAFAFTVTLAATMAYLFIQDTFSLPAPTAATFVLLLGGSWFAGLGISCLRYR